MILEVNEINDVNTDIKDDRTIIFSSEFLEFTSTKMDIVKQILDFATKTFAKYHELEPIGYLVQGHYIAYFTKRLAKLPDSQELNMLNEKFQSAVRMLRIFVADKRDKIVEIKEK